MKSEDAEPTAEAESRASRSEERAVEPVKAGSEDTTAERVDGGAESETGAVVSAGRWNRLRRLPLGRPGPIALRSAAAILVGVSVACACYWYIQNDNSKDLLAAQEDARAAACHYAPILANYDSKNLDAYFTAVGDGATGDWKKQFESTSAELREVLGQGQVTSATRDVQCAIRAGDEHSAEAIVIIGQTITSLGTKGKPAPGQLSMVMRLEKVGDRWLVNKVNSPLALPPQP
jgi:Mce-associated membrane protein